MLLSGNDQSFSFSAQYSNTAASPEDYEVAVAFVASGCCTGSKQTQVQVLDAPGNGAYDQTFPSPDDSARSLTATLNVTGRTVKLDGRNEVRLAFEGRGQVLIGVQSPKVPSGGVAQWV